MLLGGYNKKPPHILIKKHIYLIKLKGILVQKWHEYRFAHHFDDKNSQKQPLNTIQQKEFLLQKKKF